MYYWITSYVLRTVCKRPGNTVLSEEYDEKAASNRDRWRSIYVIYASSFVGCLSYSLYLTSIWPYLRSLDATADKGFLGWIAMMYSLTQMIASPVIGTWANRINQVRLPILVTLIANCAGHLMYTGLGALPSGPEFQRKYALMVARVIVGISGAGTALFRSYISQATTLKEKTGAQSIISACQALGLILGPAVQSGLSCLTQYSFSVPAIALYVDIFTVPGWLAFILGAVNIVLILVCFHEHNMAGLDPEVKENCHSDLPRPQRTQKTDHGPRKTSLAHLAHVLHWRRTSHAEPENDSTKPGASCQADKAAQGVCMLVIFVAVLLSNTMETLATPLSMDMYAWSDQEAMQHVAKVLSIGASISFVATLSVGMLSKYIDERKLLCWLGFAVMLVAYIICFPWGNNLPILQGQYNYSAPMNIMTEQLGDYNLTVLMPANMYLGTFKLDGNGTGVSVASTVDNSSLGCPPDQVWCSYTPITEKEQFLAGYFLFCVGYAVSVAVDFGLFSKILGPQPQGTAMGVMSSVSSLGRTCGPVLVGQLYTRLGPRVLFGSLAGITFFTLLVLLVFYKHLVPWQTQPAPSQHKEIEEV